MRGAQLRGISAWFRAFSGIQLAIVLDTRRDHADGDDAAIRAPGPLPSRRKRSEKHT